MKIAIISGASSGIGKCIAKELDLLGLDCLWLIGRNEERLCKLQAELNTDAKTFALDLTENDSYEAIKSELDKGCEIEYLVLSAGVGCNGQLDSLKSEQISNMIDTNCKALTLLTNTALPYINIGGKILFIASGAGFLPQPGFSVYAATKSYTISLSRALRKELKSRKIKVTAACPGPVDTNFFAGLENVPEYKKKYLISPERVAKGSLKAVNKGKAIYTPTLSMKAVHLASKLLPTSLLTSFYK